MKKGSVKFFNSEKGYGFITEEETGTDYFVHLSGCEDTIDKGDKVLFEIGEGRKGPVATNVKLDND